MSEPTIDEMLEWIGGVFNSTRSYDRDRAMREAVRAILEQHASLIAYVNQREIVSIRAFVERVELRWDAMGTPYASAVLEELAAMEKEAE